MSEFISTILTIFQLIISFGTVCTLLYAFVKFSQKPQQTQDERINSLEDRVSVLEGKQNDTNERLSNIENGNHVIQQSLLAMLDHAINGNNTESLIRTRDLLYQYLTKKG